MMYASYTVMRPEEDADIIYSTIIQIVIEFTHFVHHNMSISLKITCNTKWKAKMT